MKSKKVSLRKRFEHSVEEAKRGGGGGSVFDWSKIKGEVKFYKTNKYGRHKIIILPFWMKSKNNMAVRSGEFEIGDPDYMLEYWSHKGMGPAHDRKVICLNKMYGKDCPICNQRNEWLEKGKKKEADAIRPQQSAIYNIYDANDMDAGIQILDVSYSNFQKKMIREASDYNNGEPVYIGEPDNLKVITFKSFEDSFVNPNGGGAAKYSNYESFRFEDCEDKIDPSIIDETFSFDEALKVPTTEEIEKMFYGDDEDTKEKDNSDDEDEEKPKAKPKANPVDDDEEDSEDDDTDTDEDESEDEDEDTDDEDSEEEEEEEEEEESAPKVKPKPVAKKTVVGKPVTVFKCPSKHVFGKDCNKFKKDCGGDNCDIWDDCLKEQRKLNKK
jgi:hypothetical protein